MPIYISVNINYSLFINNKLVWYSQHVSCLNSSLSSTGTIMVCCDMRVNNVYHSFRVILISWRSDRYIPRNEILYTAKSFHSTVHLHWLICTGIKESIHIFSSSVNHGQLGFFFYHKNCLVLNGLVLFLSVYKPCDLCAILKKGFIKISRLGWMQKIFCTMAIGHSYTPCWV